jgi:hypothetical protein
LTLNIAVQRKKDLAADKYFCRKARIAQETLLHAEAKADKACLGLHIVVRHSGSSANMFVVK